MDVQSDEVIIPGDEVLVLKKANYLLGCRARSVDEIITIPNLTSLPLAPPWLMGIFRHQGELFPTIDLATFLGLVRYPDYNFNQCVLVDHEHIKFAVLAERVVSVLPRGVLSISEQSRSDDMVGIHHYFFDQQEILVPELKSLLRNPDDSEELEAGPPSPLDEGSDLIEFFLSGVPFVADVSMIESVADARSSERDSDGAPLIATVPLAGILGFEVTPPSRTLVVNVDGARVGLQVDSISRTAIKRYSIYPVPPLLQSWIRPMVYAGIALAPKGDRLIHVLDLQKIVTPLLSS